MIPFVDMRQQFEGLRSEILTAVTRALDSGQYVLGPEVKQFENEFAQYCGAEHAIAVNSGTSALHLALLAAGVGPGDEVITVPLTFVATVAAIRYTGAKPVFVDVERETLTMDPALVERAVTPSTKAIVPVHLYGHPVQMVPILAVAKKHGLTVIEDACQAHGAEYKGRRTGNLGDFGCFSFYPTKNLGACGEGGVITTNNASDARVLRMYRDWGQEVKNVHVLRGYNHRLEGLQAAILRVKLRRLEQWNERRRQHARYYNDLLRGADVVTPTELPGCRHVYHLYVIRSRARAELQRFLQSRGIDTAIHYPTPVHLQPAHEDLKYRRGAFPVAEEAAETILSLPMFPELRSDQLEAVVDATRNFSRAAAA
jgi:dTDP-4-amino-4,6-dideoxygalactose transaminase